MDQNQLSDLLFYPKRSGWGLRGDPMLWMDLEKHMRQLKNVPESGEAFRRVLEQLFEKLVGSTLQEGVNIFVERYQQGGMSSGMVSGDFWLHTAIPLLVERYEDLRSRQDV